MSHFTVLVLVDPAEGIESEIEQLMAPYNEGTEVPEYERPCSCVGHQAGIEIRKQVESELGSIDDLRDMLKETHGDEQKKSFDLRNEIIEAEKLFGGKSDEVKRRRQERNALDAEVDKVWSALLQPRHDREAELTKKHPAVERPDPDCDECTGTGKEMSTYNPDSQWDWYRKGGRWDGWLTDTEPESGDGGFNFGPQHETLEKNSIKVEKLIGQDEPKIPHALLTPDGGWHQKGEMGWFGMSHNEQDPQEWETQVLELFEEHRDCLAVALDCHI